MRRFRAIAGILLLTVSLFSAASCSENSDCYDEQLYQLHKNDNCPNNCPGIVGCDGNAYCNECEANKHGVRAGR